MKEAFERTKRLFGTNAMEKLYSSKVAVFGIGGVGSYTVEALARSGVGQLDLFDKDVVEETNINRQLIADYSTIGKAKVDVAAERIARINPDCIVNAYKIFYLPETAEGVDLAIYDYIVDAVDTVTAKLTLANEAIKAGVPIISSMGTGNKLDATRFMVADIYETKGDGLAKVMRRECRKRGISSLKVVYSDEEAQVECEEAQAECSRVPASNAFVPSVAGLIIAGEVVKDIINKDRR